MKKTQLKTVYKYFELAIQKDLLRFNYDDASQWLTVEYMNTLSYEGDKFVYHMLCAQDIKDYTKSIDLVNRITLMLAEGNRSKQQDINILMDERGRIS
jgi:ribosome biogenesis SPOUT family RNA methylase Rps3